jgi:23S rRNA pseudouridine2605 synthase
VNEGIRLNRFLAMCGLGARRKVEDIISSGRVKVDGKVVLMPAYRVEEGNEVTVDGSRVQPESKVYVVMNKPAGWVCSVSDPFDPVIAGLLPEKYRSFRLFPVGRLDRETEGLLILTNDGTFAQEVLHPSRRILREYHALLDREINRKSAREWLSGVELDGRLLKPASVLILDREPAGRWVSVVLAEGVKREVRRMAQSLGFEVEVLVRKRIGKMELKELPAGKFVEMSRGELWNAIRSGGSV